MKDYIYDEDEFDLVFVQCKDCKYAGTNDCVLEKRVPFKQDAFCSCGDAR